MKFTDFTEENTGYICSRFRYKSWYSL